MCKPIAVVNLNATISALRFAIRGVVQLVRT